MARLSLKKAVANRHAWTGGSRPSSEQRKQPLFKKLKRTFFREQVKDAGGVRNLGPFSKLGHARILFNRARMDAHATLRANKPRYDKKSS